MLCKILLSDRVPSLTQLPRILDDVAENPSILLSQNLTRFLIRSTQPASPPTASILHQAMQCGDLDHAKLILVFPWRVLVRCRRFGSIVSIRVPLLRDLEGGKGDEGFWMDGDDADLPALRNGSGEDQADVCVFRWIASSRTCSCFPLKRSIPVPHFHQLFIFQLATIVKFRISQ